MQQNFQRRAVQPKSHSTPARAVMSACLLGPAQQTYLRLALSQTVVAASALMPGREVDNGLDVVSQDQQAVPMDTDEQQAKRTLSHWSTEEKEAFLACFKVRVSSARTC